MLILALIPLPSPVVRRRPDAQEQAAEVPEGREGHDEGHGEGQGAQGGLHQPAQELEEGQGGAKRG